MQAPRSFLTRYGVAAGCAALAVLVRLALDPLVGRGFPFALVFAAITVAVWYGGLGPGVLTALLGLYGVSWLLIEPRGVFALKERAGSLGVATYFLACAVVLAFGTALRRARQRAQNLSAEAEVRQRQSTEALALLDALVTNAPVGVGFFDLELRFARVNPALADINGLPADEHLGKTVAQLLPGLPAAVSQKLRQVLDTGKPLLNQEEAGETPRAPGERRHWLTSYYPVQTPDGGLLGAACVVLETTELRRAERAAHRAEERLALALRAARMVAWEHDHLRHRLLLSDNAADVLGLPPGTRELCPANRALDLVHPDDQPAYQALLIEALQQRSSYLCQFRFVRPDNGAVVWVEDRGSILRDAAGDLLGASGILLDVSERRRAEEALRESERRYRTLAEALPNLVWTDLPDGQCDYLSSQWGRYTGIPERELLGLNWLSVLHPDDRDRTLACWRAAVEDRGVYDLEYRIRRADGMYRWFKTRGVPVRDAEGRIVYWFGTCTDIHDQKEAEASLRELDRRKDEFLATLAHELRNPLAPIGNAVEILKRDDASAEELAPARTMLERQMRHMVRLVDDLLDMARITQGKIELRKQRIELAAAVRDAVETSRPALDAAGHTLTIDLPPEPVYLNVDPTRLAQVIANLLNNSARYTPPGGHVGLSAACAGGEVVLRVRDDGVGIPAEALPHVFELFTQAHRGSERAQGGLGIGLTLVKTLVDQHGGSVEAHSAGPGRGSEFVVRLPAAVGPGAGLGRPADNGRVGAGHGRRVLVVDDNRDAADSLALLLRLLGDEVRTAHDGPGALAAATAFAPEVVLLDLGLPGLDGYEVARRLRQQPQFARALVVAISGWGQDEDRRQSCAAGFDAHLVKPVDLDVLQRLLAEAAGQPR